MDEQKNLYNGTTAQICVLFCFLWFILFFWVFEIFRFFFTVTSGLIVVILFLVYMIIGGALLLFIIRIRRKLYNPNRFEKLMSSTLITGLSHELKTPLSIIRALIENWDYIDENDRESYLDQISSEVNHVSDLVMKMQKICRIDSRGIKSKKEKVNLYDLVEEAMEHHRFLIEERKLTITINADSCDECVVKGNLEMLRIVVGNFFSNAVKYSMRDVKVELYTGRRVQFRITNDGDVLNDEEAQNVWDMFYKRDLSRSNRFGGNGVGLSVTKKILDAHKAKYGYTRENGKNVFWFEMKQVKKGERFK